LGARICADWARRGMRSLILENDNLRVIVLPDYGAKILEFRLKSADRDLLYHNPRVEIRTPVYGVNVDNWWHGGIDECIPTGQVSMYRGEEYPYLGEIWSLPWEFEIQKNDTKEVTAHLWRPTIIAPLLVERWMTLKDHGSILEMRHKITNLGYSDFQFLWGIHPGIAINKSSRIDLPQSRVIVDTSYPDNRLGSTGDSYEWPYAKTTKGQTLDMGNVASPQSQTWDLHYATEFAEGWLAVTDTSAKVGFGMAFPKDIFRCIWLWLVYGGWRGLYCVAVEAWTGYPGKLEDAIKNGKCSRLEAGENLTCETRLVGHKGFSRVHRIGPDGEVEGS
jgi:galactose mutarotase-like enzyme